MAVCVGSNDRGSLLPGRRMGRPGGDGGDGGRLRHARRREDQVARHVLARMDGVEPLLEREDALPQLTAAAHLIVRTSKERGFRLALVRLAQAD